jgi:predicted MPP superfamily phosphohydrolase
MSNIQQLLISAGILFTGGLLFIFIFNRAIVKTECRTRKMIFGSLLMLVTVVPLLLSLYLNTCFAYTFIIIIVIFLITHGIITLCLKARYYAQPEYKKIDLLNNNRDTPTYLTTQSLQKKYHKLFFPDINEPIKIVQISDIHITDCLPISYFQNVMKQVEEEKPDILAVTGDFLDRPSHFPLIEDMLKPVGKHANLFILGNHDIWQEPKLLASKLEELGFTRINNKRHNITIRDTIVSLNSYEKPWNKTDKIPEIDKNVHINICLTHTADNIFKLAEQNFDIVFSGHYHGGQWRLPIFGSMIVPSLFGRLFDMGHFMVKKTHLFVNTGIGLAHPACRINCHPEIIVLELTNE